MAEVITIQLNTVAAGAGVQATVSGLNRVKGAVDSAGTALGNFARRMAVGLIPTLTIAGIGRFVQHTIESADAMGKAAQKAGESVVEFSRLSEVGKLAGVSMYDLTAAARNLPEWLEKNGQSGRSLSQVLVEQADIFAKMPDSMEKARLATEMFGRAGQNLIPLLNQGSEALQKQIEEAERFGLVIGPRFARDAERFNDGVSRVFGILRGIANIVAAAIVPALNEMIESFIEWVKDGDKHLKFADAMIAKFEGLALAINFANTTAQLFFGALPAYLGALSGGAGLKEAADIATNQLKQITDAYEKRKALIEQIARRADPANGSNQEDPPGTRMTDIQAQRLELEKNSLRIAEIRGMVDEAQFNRNKAMQTMIKERIELLEYAAQLEIDAVPESKRTLAGEETAEYAEAIARANNHLEEMIRLKAELFGLDQDSFFERFTESIQLLTEEFDALGAAISDVLINGIQRSMDAVSDGMWRVIDGTATWGQIFQQVARNIISDLIRIALQEIVLDTLKRGIVTAWNAFSKSMRASDTADQNANELSKTPALAANATLSSIQSYGIAVAIGVAAIAAILATVGAFQEGGVVSGGDQLIRVNERGQEAVLNARATSMLGAETINALNAGEMAALAARVEGDVLMTGGVASSGGNSPSVNASFLLVDNMYSQAARDYIASNAGQAQIIEVIRNNRYDAGIG